MTKEKASQVLLVKIHPPRFGPQMDGISTRFVFSGS